MVRGRVPGSGPGWLRVISPLPHVGRRLAREGQVVEKASDLIKDPVVLEFLGLEEAPAYGVKIDGELPTVGILLCDDKNDAVVELTLPEDANIYASKYQLYLPSREELADQVARVRREIGGREGRNNG